MPGARTAISTHSFTLIATPPVRKLRDLLKPPSELARRFIIARVNGSAPLETTRNKIRVDTAENAF
jgi:hypothetical protein